MSLDASQATSVLRAAHTKTTFSQAQASLSSPTKACANVATALCKNLGTAWKALIPGSKSLSTTSTDSTPETVRGGSIDSGFSSQNALEFKLIHLDAAIAMVNRLQKLHLRPGQDNPFPKVLEQLFKAKDNLRHSALERASIDSDGVRKAIGGKTKSFQLTIAGFRYWREIRALVKAGRLGHPIPTQTSQAHIRLALAAYIRGALKATGFYKDVIDIKFLDKLSVQEYVKVLHQQPWARIELSHRLTFNGAPGACRTEHFLTQLTPAAQLSAELARSYKKSGIQGVCSYATQEAKHAVNLWRTRFAVKTDSQSDREEPLFSGIRHGVHDAYGFHGDERLRARANHKRALEFVHACLQDHMARKPLSPTQVAGKSVVKLPIVSVNLLTPMGKEKSMIEHQMAAYQILNEKELILKLSAPQGNTPIEIRVQPHFLALNLPVNAISLSSLSDVAGIWKYSDGINAQALSALIGTHGQPEEIGGLAAQRLAEFAEQLGELKKPSANGPNSNGSNNQEAQRALHRKISMIRTLVRQIRDITHHKSHHRVGNEPYKLAVRILALANECGATPAFNCKSGKDRTGQLNVEVRDFYAHYHGTGKVREPDASRSTFEVDNYQALFAKGGDREIQILNTGVPGSKSQLPFYHALLKVVPTKMDAIKGLSKWVGS